MQIDELTDIERLVLKFADPMANTVDRHMLCDDWLVSTPDVLFKHLSEQGVVLAHHLAAFGTEEFREDLATELAARVAILAAMIADRCGGLPA